MVVDGKTYKLVYYDLKTLGEPIRQIFHYIGVPFEDVRVDPATWSDVKEDYLWQHLPELHVSDPKGKTLCLSQSTAICRYLANSYPEFELMPEDAWEKARCDEFADAIQDLRMRLKPFILAKYYVNIASAEKLAAMKKDFYYNQGFVLFISNMEEILDNERKSGYFITGEKLRWADIFVANFTSIWEDVLGTDFLETHPLLKRQQTAVQSHPKIKEWIEKRKATIV